MGESLSGERVAIATASGRERFRESITYLFREEIKRELRGKDLMCWCRLDHPCHADVLLEIANS